MALVLVVVVVVVVVVRSVDNQIPYHYIANCNATKHLLAVITHVAIISGFETVIHLKTFIYVAS